MANWYQDKNPWTMGAFSWTMNDWFYARWVMASLHQVVNTLPSNDHSAYGKPVSGQKSPGQKPPRTNFVNDKTFLP